MTKVSPVVTESPVLDEVRLKLGALPVDVSEATHEPFVKLICAIWVEFEFNGVDVPL